jgi:hypothetical protein
MTTKLTLEQAIIISAYTGVTACAFKDMHVDVERRLKRSVWMHEFASKDFLDKIKDLYRDDFLAICAK